MVTNYFSSLHHCFTLNIKMAINLCNYKSLHSQVAIEIEICWTRLSYSLQSANFSNRSEAILSETIELIVAVGSFLLVCQCYQLVDPDMFRRNIALMKSMGHIEKYTLPHSVATGYRKCRLANKNVEIGVRTTACFFVRPSRRKCH